MDTFGSELGGHFGLCFFDVKSCKCSINMEHMSAYVCVCLCVGDCVGVCARMVQEYLVFFVPNYFILIHEMNVGVVVLGVVAEKA